VALGKLRRVSVDGLTIRRTLTRLRLRDRAPSAAARAFDDLLDAEASLVDAPLLDVDQPDHA
jgi:hypothetical protein